MQTDEQNYIFWLFLTVVLDDSKSITNMRGPQRTNLNDFGDPLVFLYN